MSLWKRSGWLALCLLVALVSIIMQVFGVFAGQIQFCLQEMGKLNEQGLLTDATANEVMNRAYTDGMGLMLLWSHIFMVVCFALICVSYGINDGGGGWFDRVSQRRFMNRPYGLHRVRHQQKQGAASRSLFFE